MFQFDGPTAIQSVYAKNGEKNRCKLIQPFEGGKNDKLPLCRHNNALEYSSEASVWMCYGKLLVKNPDLIFGKVTVCKMSPIDVSRLQLNELCFLTPSSSIVHNPSYSGRCRANNFLLSWAEAVSPLLISADVHVYLFRRRLWKEPDISRWLKGSKTSTLHSLSLHRL